MTSDDLFHLCLRCGADAAAAAGWHDGKRRDFIKERNPSLLIEKLTGQTMLASVGHLAVIGKKTPAGLVIGNVTVDKWPESFDVNGIHFVYTEEESLWSDDGSFQGIYFQQEKT